MSDFPAGSCVVTPNGRWYISLSRTGLKLRHQIINKRIFDSWSFPLVIKTTEDELVGIKKGKRLGFRDGSFVRQLSTGTYFIISKGERRTVASPDIFKTFGLKPRSAVWVSDTEINLHPEGAVIE